MILHFVTTNKHKFIEVKKILQPFAVKIVQLDLSYEENHDNSIRQIAKQSAFMLSRSLNKTIVVEDTGLFFDAFPNFPGALPKFVFTSLGYKGIFKLLKNETRSAYFETVVGFCKPKDKPKLFSGKMPGVITTKVFNLHKDVMPYDRIFIPTGKNQTISHMTIDEKNTFSQRSQAFQKLGQHLSKKTNYKIR